MKTVTLEQLRYQLRLPLLIGCGQWYFLSNQIAGFFDQQYHWKEPIDIFNFLHGDNHQGKVRSKTTTLA